MSTLAIKLVIDQQAALEDLEAKRDEFRQTIELTMDNIGDHLWRLVRSKIEPVVRTEIGQGILDSIELQGAVFVGDVCSTEVFIEPSGAPSYVVAYVREFGGSGWYDIYPLETQLGFESDAGIGAGIKSPFSGKEAEPYLESRLPHVLAFSVGGNMVFAKHVLHPPAKEQSYLRSSLVEMEGFVMDELQAAVDGVLAL